MKKKSNIGTWIVTIFLIGVISAVINSDIPFGAIIKNLGSYDVEVLLEYLKLGLAFITFGLLFFFLISRFGRQEKDQDQKSLPEENRESE